MTLGYLVSIVGCPTCGAELDLDAHLATSAPDPRRQAAVFTCQSCHTRSAIEVRAVAVDVCVREGAG